MGAPLGLALIAFVVGDVGTLYLFAKGHVRLYQVRPEYRTWGWTRRVNGHWELGLGKWVLTSEPG